MQAVMYPVATVIGWIVLIYKLNDLREDFGNKGARTVFFSLLFPTAAFTIATPAVYGPLDAAIGFPNMAKLLLHGTLVIFAATVQRMLLLWTYPIEEARPRVRRRIAAALVVFIVMTVMLSEAHVPVHAVHFTQTYAATPWVAEYLLVYLIALGIALVEIARLCWAFAKVAGRPWLVRGLRVTAIGAAIGIGYCLTKAVYVIARNMGVDLSIVGASSPVFAGIGSPLVAIGLSLPSLGPRLGSLGDIVRRWRAFQALYPLWKAMVEPTPDLVLPSSAGRRNRWSTSDLTFRLIREVAEIQDARLGLRDYMDPAIAEAARAGSARAGLSQDDVGAVTEAAMLKAALRARAEGRPGAAVDDDPDILNGFETSGLTDETDWLMRVAREFAHSPVVRSVVTNGRPTLVIER